MNQSALNREHYYPLDPLLQKINAVSTLSGLQALIPELQLMSLGGKRYHIYDKHIVYLWFQDIDLPKLI